uniref:protoporphyrinogen/coproporphyrinogen oxidase n=1 Tax=Nonomuraea pusilla TaxID=46177 RepID=UPI0006E1EDA8|nr:FAD-dependent oxidoreductase [Nonomuraea pusilla]
MNRGTLTTGVVVIGAGLAGLTAAYELRARGVDVLVLESADRPGGRMSSDRAHGFVVDRGAQFVSTGYERLMPLLRRLGLADELVPTSTRAGFVRDGEIVTVSPANPATFVTAGLLPAGAALRAGAGFARTGPRLRRRALHDLAQWQDLDTRSGDGWSRAVFGDVFTDRVMDAMVSGFYFQNVAGNSAALPAILTGFTARRAATMALRRGLGAVTEALAERAPLFLETPALEVREAGGGVEVATPDRTIAAGAAVVATPGPAAARLLPGSPDSDLLSTPYSSTILVALRYGPGWRSRRLDGVYGVLVPVTELRTVAAVGVESGKARALVPEGELLNVMLSESAASRLRDAGDDTVIEHTLDELAALVPEARSQVTGATVHRWSAALPWTPVGQAARVAAYRESVAAAAPRVILAGDYLGLPFTDSVVHTGQWAAAQALRLVSPRTG